jgi:putative transposase
MPRRKAPVIPADLLDQLLAGGDVATAPNSGGLLDALKKALAERALNAEMDYHLDDAGEAGNTRNGYGRKTVTTGIGKVESEVPRVSGGDVRSAAYSAISASFPRLRRQDHLDVCTGHEHPGDRRALARDLRHGRLGRSHQHDHRRRSRGSRRLAAPTAGSDLPAGLLRRHHGQDRDEGPVHNKAIYIALGVMADGTKVVPGMWIEQNEGAKFWLRVMNELKNRGGEDIMLAVVDGLKGFLEAITAVFPETIVQTCIVDLLRNSRWTSCPSRTARRWRLHRCL